MLTYTVGDLIDKLCVVHLKIWHIEEKIETIKESTKEEDLEIIEKLLNQVVSLNELRVKIVDSLNEILDPNDKK